MDTGFPRWVMTSCARCCASIGGWVSRGSLLLLTLLLNLGTELGLVFGFVDVQFDGHALTFARASIHAAQRGHVGVVTPDGDPDMALGNAATVGWIKTDPARVRQQRLDPGMACHFVDRLLAILHRFRCQVAGDVARGHTREPEYADGQMRKVLAHAASRTQDFVKVRMHAGGTFFIVELIADVANRA